MNEHSITKPDLKVFLAAPRGFCAGVDRAIKIVEQAIEKFGAPVYVRHEIVHNKFVVDGLRDKGAIFVEELTQIPANDEDRPVIFSAHGVPKKVPENAEKKNMFYIDATCPLVSKVHREAERHFKNGLHVILIGHKGHPEVIGTMGQLPEGAMTLIETKDDVASLNFSSNDDLAYVTQTTLSVDDTADIVSALEERFPSIKAPFKEDICYATTNRQSAVKTIAQQCGLMLVIGAKNSSNSNRLVEVAKNYGAEQAYLINDRNDIDLSWFNNVGSIGITAGASAPEILVENVIEFLNDNFTVSMKEVVTAEESIEFKLPKAVA